jgi:hypothetical protein
MKTRKTRKMRERVIQGAAAILGKRHGELEGGGGC